MYTAAADPKPGPPHFQENKMAKNLNTSKLSKTMKIFGAVQLGLVALLVYMAVNFQHKLALMGRTSNFLYGVIIASIVQLAIFFPIKKFAAKEADRDLYLASAVLTKEEVKEYSKKKRWSDIIKMSTFGFFIIFILAAPTDPLVLSVIYYTFILTILTYLQCYNFAAKKLVKEQGEPKK